MSGVTGVDRDVRFAFSDAGDGNVSLAVGTPDPQARARLAASVGVRPTDLVFMQQIHGDRVAVVDARDRGRGLTDHDDGMPAVDALVTFAPGLALAVQVADCVPVLLADPGRAVAAVHAGRGGVVAGVVGAALATMDPPDVREVEAVIGPAIGGCCYEVGGAMADAVSTAVPAARAATTWDAPSLDLPAAVVSQLHAAGVERVARVGGCTRCSGERWFSHRRAPGVGRQAGVVVRASGDTATTGSGRRHA